MQSSARPTLDQIRQAARILRMPVEILRKAVDNYFDDPPRLGRPPISFDSATVATALDGRSVKEAARILAVSENTLRAYFNRQKK
jgi:DNA-directed RNA polymerase specialized sigma24 family protein